MSRNQNNNKGSRAQSRTRTVHKIDLYGDFNGKKGGLFFSNTLGAKLWLKHKDHLPQQHLKYTMEQSSHRLTISCGRGKASKFQ
jgi:hypothetical protein